MSYTYVHVRDIGPKKDVVWYTSTDVGQLNNVVKLKWLRKIMISKYIQSKTRSHIEPG